MKDSINHLFRDRFQGHEAPVDPATWQVIEARLIAAGPATDPVNDLFRERFDGHESPVDPKAWNTISSQLGHPVASSGLGWMAAGVAGVVAIGAMVFALEGGPEKKPEIAQAAPVVAELAVEDSLNPALDAETRIASTPVAAETSTGSSTAPSTRMVQPYAPAASPAEQNPVSAAPLITDEDQRPPENPAVVEQIIQAITEQVKQEVAEESRRMPQSEPGSGTLITEEPADSPAPEEESPKLLLPNTFTPNNDGINDRYEVSLVGFSSLMMRVYSIKTNQLVFSTNSGEPWVGMNCEDGMYLVAVEAMTLEGRMVADGKVVYLNRNSTN